MSAKPDMKKNKGFTLVELIVVLVILAVLAAILVPTLTGYIDEARNKKDISSAEAALEATRAMFAKQYGINGGTVAPGKPVVPGSTQSNNNGDQDITKTDFAKNVLALVDYPKDKKGNYTKPYLFMVAVGSNLTDVALEKPMEEYEKYTVFYAVYMETDKSKPLYYYNGEWSTENPHVNVSFNNKNVVQNGPLKGKRMQYYLIVNKTGKTIYNKAFWDWIEGLSD